MIELGKSYRLGYPAAFTSSLGYSDHRGMTVRVIRALTADECDEEQAMFLVEAEDGWQGHAFDDELVAADKGAYALQETLASEKRGKPVWFRFWTIIGPCCTENEAERALFHSKNEAMQSSAFTHALSFFEPVELAETPAVGNFDWNRS